jgi:hypothetical protein
MARGASLPVRRDDDHVIKELQALGKKLDPGGIDTVIVGHEDHGKNSGLTGLIADRYIPELIRYFLLLVSCSPDSSRNVEP